MTRLLSAFDNKVVEEESRVVHLLGPPCPARELPQAMSLALLRATDDEPLTCLWCAARWGRR